MGENQHYALWWIRGDLRLRDNRVVADAHRAAPGRILPVYVWSDRAFGRTPRGFPKTGPFRAQFLIDAVEDLEGSLARFRVPLLQYRGPVDQAMETVAEELRRAVHGTLEALGSLMVFYQREAFPEEQREVAAVENALRRWGEHQGISVAYHPVDQQALHLPKDLPMPDTDIPWVYTHFRTAVEKRGSVRPPQPVPTLQPTVPVIAQLAATARFHYRPTPADLTGTAPPARDPRSVAPHRGGESAAWDRVREYIWDGDYLRRYKETRNGLIGANYSSKFSPYLAHGCLSPRDVAAEVRHYESERVRNRSTYWMIFELLWRDYYLYLARTVGASLYRLTGPQERELEWREDTEAFERWRQGTTGEPFVDANMRELLTTGFMSNRGRQVVASYLAHDLAVPWTWGAEWFESQLVDYDPGSNWGNWAYNAGVGTDPREDRYFNPSTQAERYDPRAEYRRLWLSAPGPFPGSVGKTGS
jgi:deoxyribodipyrimidine photo-lyase